jgi:hypothetical protein
VRHYDDDIDVARLYVLWCYSGGMLNRCVGERESVCVCGWACGVCGWAVVCGCGRV